MKSRLRDAAARSVDDGEAVVDYRSEAITIEERRNRAGQIVGWVYLLDGREFTSLEAALDDVDDRRGTVRS